MFLSFDGHRWTHSTPAPNNLPPGGDVANNDDDAGAGFQFLVQQTFPAHILSTPPDCLWIWQPGRPSLCVLPASQPASQPVNQSASNVLALSSPGSAADGRRREQKRRQCVCVCFCECLHARVCVCLSVWVCVCVSVSVWVCVRQTESDREWEKKVSNHVPTILCSMTLRQELLFLYWE